MFTQVSTSVLPLIPGETVGTWTADADGTGVSTLGGESLRWWEFNKTTFPPYRNMVAVDAAIEYDFSLWMYGQGSPRVRIELRDQDGNLAVGSGGITNSDPNAAQTSPWYLVEDVRVRDGWVRYQTRVRLKPGVRFVRVGYIFGNQDNSRGTRFCIADMQLCPHVVQQREVDKAQDDAIKALEQQQAWQRTWNVERARIDARQDREIKRLDSVQNVQKSITSRLDRTAPEIVLVPGDRDGDVTGRFGTLSKGSTTLSLTFRRGWRGTVLLNFNARQTILTEIERFSETRVVSSDGSGETLDLYREGFIYRLEGGFIIAVAE